MAKKQELKALLDSDTKKTMSQRSSKILEQTIKKSTKRMEDESMKTEPQNIREEKKQVEKPEEKIEQEIDQIMKNPMMLEYKLSEVEEKTIQELEKEHKYFITILDVFTSTNEKQTATFNKDDVIKFQVICVATEIFSKLSADFRIEAIAQDLSNFLPQKIYSFSYESKLKCPYFEINFQTKAVLEGIFRFQVIFTIGQLEYFYVHDQCVYRVI